MTCRGILVAVAASVLLAASAATAYAGTDEGRLGWFLPISRAAWPDSPCMGREVIHLHANDAIASAAPALGASANQILGFAMPSTCEVWIRDGLEPQAFCVTLTHELGHLAGRGHSTVPGDVMNGEGDSSWQPCVDAVRRARQNGRARWQAATHRRISLPWPWGH